MGLNSHSQHFEVLLLCSTSWCYWAKPTTTILKGELHLFYQILKVNWRKKLIWVTIQKKFQVITFTWDRGTHYPFQPAEIFSLILLMTDKFKHSVWNSTPTITLFQTWMSLGEILHHSWQWIAQNDCHSRWKGNGLMTLWHFRKYTKKETPWFLEIQETRN